MLPKHIRKNSAANNYKIKNVPNISKIRIFMTNKTQVKHFYLNYKAIYNSIEIRFE